MRVNMMRTLVTIILLAGFVLPALAQQPGKGLTPMQAGMPAPDFELTDIEGTTHRLSDYRDKVVIINFWATWCPPCRAEMPSMDRAWAQLEDEDIVMLAVNVGEDEDTIFQFTANYPVTFPLLMDRDSKVVEAWPIRGLPTTFVIDPGGRLAYRAIGGREWDDPELLEQVRALRSGASAPEQGHPQP
jgi:peroxiredoxin